MEDGLEVWGGEIVILRLEFGLDRNLFGVGVGVDK